MNRALDTRTAFLLNSEARILKEDKTRASVGIYTFTEVINGWNAWIKISIIQINYVRTLVLAYNKENLKKTTLLFLTINILAVNCIIQVKINKKE